MSTLSLSLIFLLNFILVVFQIIVLVLFSIEVNTDTVFQQIHTGHHQVYIYWLTRDTHC